MRNGVFVFLTSFLLACCFTQNTWSAPNIRFDELAGSLGLPATNNRCVAEKEIDPWIAKTNKRICSSFALHLRTDSRQNCRPHPTDVLKAAKFGLHKIRGTTTYLSVSNRPYRYDLTLNKNYEVELTINLFFFTESIRQQNDLVRNIEAKIGYAERLWTSKSPLNMTFNFNVVDNVNDAHFVIPLTDKSVRSPYDALWSTAWDEQIVAHELGHMMGLNDEYDQFETTLGLSTSFLASKCSAASLMCESSPGGPLLYHYYLILRRMICDNKNGYEGLSY